MSQTTDTPIGRETTAVWTSAIDAAWMSISPEQQGTVTKSEVAALILKLAERGERDPVRLRAYGALQAAEVANQRAFRRRTANGR